MPKKVTDPAKIVTDKLVLKRLAEQGIDKDYVEFWHDYAPRSKGKEYSPYAKFYRDLKSGKKIMVVSGLPMVKPDGKKIEVGFIPPVDTPAGRFRSKPNLFLVEIAGKEVTLTCLSDQPDGIKKDEQVTWRPQLFIDGSEVINGEQPTLLPIDPINENYHENVLEWSYGSVCKRRIRIIEGRFRERWLFESNPRSKVRIKHNFTGSLKLKLGYARDAVGNTLKVSVIGDEEIIEASEFDKAVYPVEIGAEQTFYPDPATSVDGTVRHGVAAAGTSWAAIRDGAGTDAHNTEVYDYCFQIYSGTTSNLWRWIFRGIYLFDTSPLPDDEEITDATLSIFRAGGEDGPGWAPNINVYASAPASNTVLVAGDYNSLGTTPFCDTPIAYGDWGAGYNDFPFNADGIAAISKTGISKFGTRNANYDVANFPPAWVSGVWAMLYGFFSEKGNGYKPKLVVTYGVPTITTQDADEITSVSAKLHGTIAALNNGNCDERGFDWGKPGQFKISINSAAHTDYGLGYPVTYKFSIPAAAVNLTAWQRKIAGGILTQLPSKTTDDFFNGIDAVRFDYENDVAYVSVAFGSESDDIFLLFKDAAGGPVAGVSFVEICAYYDNRKAVVVLTHDDYQYASSQNLAAMDETRARHLWLTLDIITDPGGGGPDWAPVQTRLDLGYLEVASHSWTHPYIPYDDYDLEIGDSKQSIIDNLDLPATYKKNSTEYLVAWIEPYGQSDATARAKLGQYKYLCDRRATAPWEHVFATWDAANGLYNRICVSHYVDIDTEAEIKDGFDARYAAGEIYHLIFHPADWLDALQKCLNICDYIKDKKDVWYVGFGAMYMYHYVQERGLVAVSEAAYTDSWTEEGDYGVGVFEHTIAGLTPNTAYLFRAKAHSALGWGYGEDMLVVTTLVNPAVTTNPATSVGPAAATLNGTLADDGGEACNCAFEYGETEAYGTTTPTQSKVTGEAFSQPITGLDPNKTYHFRAIATNDTGTAHGADRTFTTGVAMPTVTTDEETAISQMMANLNGTLDEDGGEDCECGFEWGPDTNYGVTTPTETKTAGESFSQVIHGLQPGTTYHFRAFATNSAGTGYGADRSFTSTPLFSRGYALSRQEL